MITEMGKRKYTLRQRAEQQRETRERIVDAAMELHEKLGPAATTISAIAEQAGVQRLTVYRHFSSDAELFSACTSKWLQLHPPPAISEIADTDPLKHTRATLLALYRYYENTQGMWTVAYRDIDKLPALQAAMAGFGDYLSAVHKALMAAWAPSRSKRLAATLEHALQFSTWQSLSDLGLSRAAAAKLVCAWALAGASCRAR